jgi:hypothetical protein
MGRTIAGVLVGYLVMALVVFAVFSLAYMAMGADRAFQPGTYAPSAVWVVLSLVLSFLAAWVGGRVCAGIARNPKAVVALAVLVLVLGVVFAMPVMRRTGDPAPRSGTVGNMQAMQQAHMPLWVALLTPLVGAAGVVVGGGRRSVPPPQI